MVIDICIFLIALICTFITASYAYIFYYKRKVKSSWRNLRELYENKFTCCREYLDIAIMTYSNESDIIRALTDSVVKYAKAVTPEEFSLADKKITVTFIKVEKLMEKYPLLYEKEKFMTIKDSIIILDEKLAFSRQFYNKEISTYNSNVFKMPVRIVSSIFNFKIKNTI